jgi:ketosteroid isomerase-like protein
VRPRIVCRGDRQYRTAQQQDQTTHEAPQISGTSEIREIKVHGDWAFMWAKLAVVVTPPGGGSPTTRAGYTLSILRKEGGKWLLARDANMLAPV